jgi:hypothetical protein
MKTHSTALAAITAIAILSAPARADLRYTTEMKISPATASDGTTQPAAAGASPTIRITTFYKNMDQRRESSMDMMGLFQSHEVTLTLCDKQQIVTMLPDQKIYTTGPISGYQPPSNPAAKSAKAEKNGEGKMVTTYTVKDLGREKLQNLDTRHAMVTMDIETSGCLGVSRNTIRYEVWVAPKSVKPCPEQFAPSRVVAGANGCSITYEAKGDVAAMQQAMSGMAVQQKFYTGDKVTMTQELREFSEAALDPSLFTIPADYKQVTPAELDKARADAMQKAMLRGVNTQAAAGNGAETKAGADSSSGVAGEVADTMKDATNDAANDSKNQVKDEIRKKIKLPKIRF